MRVPRYPLIAGAIAAVLALALIGVQLRDRNAVVATPGASPTPLASGVTTISPSASASATSAATSVATAAPLGVIYNDDFGWVVTDPGAGSTIRNESSNARIGSFASQGFVPSPDGRQIAFWRPGTPAQLRVFNAAGNGTEQTLVTLAADQRGGGIAWSSDGVGLLYSTEQGSFGVGGGTNGATLDMYEFAAGGRRGTIDTQTNTGWLYRPVAWDRSVNLAAAGLTGEGAGMAFYVTVRINPNNSFSAQRVDTKSNVMGMSTIRASSDARFVLGVESDSGSIKWWPLEDFAANKSQAGAGKRGAVWRPGTHEIGFMGPSDQFWLGDVDKAGLGLCCTAFSGAPAGSSLRGFRADGTAVVLAVPQGVGLGATDYTLVRLGNDAKSISGDRVAFQDLGGLAVSVRLR